MTSEASERNPAFRYKLKRDYSGGNIRDLIAAAETLEHLEELRGEVLKLAKAGQISTDTLRKINRTGAARARELSSRVLVVPDGGRRTKGGLYLP